MTHKPEWKSDTDTPNMLNTSQTYVQQASNMWKSLVGSASNQFPLIIQRKIDLAHRPHPNEFAKMLEQLFIGTALEPIKPEDLEPLFDANDLKAMSQKG